MGTLVAVRVVLVVALTALVGCTATERACTMIAALPGVGVTVDRSVAADVSALRVTVCSADRCITRTVELAPGSDSVDGGCTGPDPDDSCSATASPNGTSTGFVEVIELREGPVRISATALVRGLPKRYPAVTVAAALVHPNGPDCGGAAPQAQVTIGPNGLR